MFPRLLSRQEVLVRHVDGASSEGSAQANASVLQIKALHAGAFRV